MIIIREIPAQLSSAQLSSAQLSSAQLSSAQLSSAQLSSARAPLHQHGSCIHDGGSPVQECLLTQVLPPCPASCQLTSRSASSLHSVRAALDRSLRSAEPEKRFNETTILRPTTQNTTTTCVPRFSKGKAAHGVPHPLPCHHVSRNCNM
jgi:hypothetical protein